MSCHIDYGYVDPSDEEIQHIVAQQRQAIARSTPAISVQMLWKLMLDLAGLLEGCRYWELHNEIWSSGPEYLVFTYIQEEGPVQKRYRYRGDADTSKELILIIAFMKAVLSIHDKGTLTPEQVNAIMTHIGKADGFSMEIIPQPWR